MWCTEEWCYTCTWVRMSNCRTFALLSLLWSCLIGHWFNTSPSITKSRWFWNVVRISKYSYSAVPFCTRMWSRNSIGWCSCCWSHRLSKFQTSRGKTCHHPWNDPAPYNITLRVTITYQSSSIANLGKYINYQTIPRHTYLKEASVQRMNRINRNRSISIHTIDRYTHTQMHTYDVPQWLRCHNV